MSIPTKEQIEKVKEITSLLNIDFPQCSKQFSKRIYKNFIDYYSGEYEKTLELMNDMEEADREQRSKELTYRY